MIRGPRGSSRGRSVELCNMSVECATELNYKPMVRVLQRHNRFSLTTRDCIYLVCEPPGEPYYLGRIMEFVRMNESSVQIDAVRVNWFYRPRDIQRQNSDSRLVFATMHSDVSPLQSIRGKCRIMHKSQILDAEAYRREPNSFYFERLFDKFMRRQYEVIPVNQVINVPEQVRLVLQKRWKYVVVEVNRAKELAMEHRACKRCGDWCASKDSVRCAICKADFHMQCVQPALPRKPTRGFAWSCTPCSRAEARRLDDLRNRELNGLSGEVGDTPRNEMIQTYEDSCASEEDNENTDISGPIDNKARDIPHRDPALQAFTVSRQWPFRYLGVHCNVKDALDSDDRIYPRAASRIGPKYQASVQDWPGRPVEYFEKVKRSIKRTAKAMKGKRSDERAALESPALEGRSSEQEHNSHNRNDDIRAHEVSYLNKTSSSDGTPDSGLIDPAAMSTAERPAWLQEKPGNYTARGEGKTAQRIWLCPIDLSDEFMEAYFHEAKSIAHRLKVDITTPNFIDIALSTLCDHNFVQEDAIRSLNRITRKVISQPTFSQDEKLRFEASVLKNGSDLAQVALDVESKNVAECVRFYYGWKKTPRGSQIWANSEARKPKAGHANKKRQKNTDSELDLIGDSSDDSAYSLSKASKTKQTFRCKFCETTTSSRWRRAPGTILQKTTIVALCNRCADLWRNYAVHWERAEETYKKLHEGGARGRKRRIEEELVKELPANGVKPEKVEHVDIAKPGKKQARSEPKESLRSFSPERPEACAVCRVRDSLRHTVCASCKLRVHPACYGTEYPADNNAWTCDPCLNNTNPTVSMVRYRYFLVPC